MSQQPTETRIYVIEMQDCTGEWGAYCSMNLEDRAEARCQELNEGRRRCDTCGGYYNFRVITTNHMSYPTG